MLTYPTFEDIYKKLTSSQCEIQAYPRSYRYKSQNPAQTREGKAKFSSGIQKKIPKADLQKNLGIIKPSRIRRFFKSNNFDIKNFE